MNPPGCFLSGYGDEAEADREWETGFRKLRNALTACNLCSQKGECAVIAEFDNLVNQTISKITREWGWV
jgi:hypothetical protein